MSGPPSRRRSPSSSVVRVSSTPAISPSGSPGISQRTSQVTVEYQGPIPDPKTLSGYGAVDPSFPERILAMTEAEQRHRHEMERIQVEHVKRIESDPLDHENHRLEMEFRNKRLGLFLGFGIAIIGMGAATYKASIGQPWPATVVGGASLAMIVGQIVSGTRLRWAGKTPE